MSGWFYAKDGLLKTEDVGPVSDHELLRLALEGTIKLKTLVVHETHTRGQWVNLELIPAAKAKFQEGEQRRQQARQQQKEEEAAARQAAIDAAAEEFAQSPLARLVLDGQSRPTVEKIYDRVSQILTPNETLEYIAVQAKPLAIAPDCVAITNRRFLVFRQTLIGRVDFDDYQWLYLSNAQLKEGVLYAEISFRVTDGKEFSIDYLPKVQARRIYRIAQEREEKAIETRRERWMEEQRAGASNIVVNATGHVAPTANSPPTSAPAATDPVAKLQQLKQMLAMGLIEQAEYDQTKARILASM